jgi:hypothetical protein
MTGWRGLTAVAAARAAFAGTVAVALGVVGLRLAMDADELAVRWAFARPASVALSVRWAGVAVLAAAQAIGVMGVVWSGYRRRRLDTWFAAIAVATAVLAALAAAVLAL